ncbi:MAG: ABC transporter ATP-binding protein [Roseiflexaceae bacterium]|jgi:ABC-type lipoprotein export system ATPase subunit|nr:ABC transporter ATP-binding protein [Chloroflexaceae bacterium]
MTRINVVGVTRIFGTDERMVAALADVNLQIADGQLVALMGPSGSGKTTLLNMISALDRPNSGEIFVDDVAIAGISDDARGAIRQRIGFIFQRFALIPTASAYENIEFALRIAHIPRDEWHTRIMHTLAQLDMQPHAHHRPSELSGGQQQRIAIARALATDPPLIIADEPTANLDSHRGATVLELFRTLCQHGKTIVMSTHDATAVRYATHICRMHAGQIVSMAPPTPTNDATPTSPPQNATASKPRTTPRNG